MHRLFSMSFYPTEEIAIGVYSQIKTDEMVFGALAEQ